MAIPNVHDIYIHPDISKLRLLALYSAGVASQRTQPNYSVEDLAAIRVPVTIVQAEHDEFIKPEHAEYLAYTIPNAKLVKLEGMSHFAPLQRPEQFNAAMLAFLSALPG